MPIHNARVKRYQYEFRAVESSGSTLNVAIVYLYDVDDNLLCMASFDESETPCPPPHESAAGHVVASFRYPFLDGFIGMLRNEKPLYFSWSPEGAVVRLTTDEEPVGEEELRKLFSFLYV